MNGNKGKGNLRKGFTTGTCAAAAAKGAAIMILTGKIIDRVSIYTPSGVSLDLPLEDMHIEDSFAQCAVIKDGGDDPDVTSGLQIFARVELTKDGVVEIRGGEGIGIVTLPGLKVDVGKHAINPVPMKMIKESVGTLLPKGTGAVVTLRVPGGEEVAKKTYNSRLGIEGGISIIGTTGIVEPMSEEAWKEALAMELSVFSKRGFGASVFVFGNYGEDFAINNMGLSRERIIRTSNFLGYMLESAVFYGVERILLCGHLGKLVKVAGGIFHTHSRVADGRMEILAAYAGLEGAPTETIREIYNSRTTTQAANIIDREGFTGVYKKIVENASMKCMEYTYGKITVGTVLFNENNRILHMDERADNIVKELRNAEA